MSSLQEFMESGACEGCSFYGPIDVDGRNGCSFEWFNEDSEDWLYSKNCDSLES